METATVPGAALDVVRVSTRILEAVPACEQAPSSWYTHVATPRGTLAKMDNRVSFPQVLAALRAGGAAAGKGTG